MYTHICLPHVQREINLIKQYPLEQDFDLSSLKASREYMTLLDHKLIDFFNDGVAIKNLLAYRSHYMDLSLQKLYRHFHLDLEKDTCLLAVGGYGRAELFLKSDIDILLVSRNELSDKAKENVSAFISYLWDLKLDIGSSVRTIQETLENANEDLTIRTNLLETRFLIGDHQVYQDLIDTITNDSTWNTKRFFHAKVAEELERHHAYKDTAYALEPDLKHNPGGIRDIQVMQWIANFHFQAKTAEDMLKLKFLSKEEYDELIESRDVLYQVRYALHITTLKEDNRLLLDTQTSVATLLGYEGDHNKKVEVMMRDLYRSLRRIRELNSMALQLEVLRITGSLGNEDPQFLSSDFICRGPLVDVVDEEVFDNDKSKILEIIALMSRYPQVVGLHVNCLRLLRKARRSLHSYLVEIPECRDIFKSLLETPATASIALPLMHEHRLLSAYMPSWERIEGLSQFDMFHTFTVDEHTIRVIKNIERLNRSEEQIHSLFKHVYQQINNHEILIVAALLHDIAKGQGGHHATLGAEEALYFCQLHKYTLYQTRLVSWLVNNHLSMSATAQRRDINDPQVVNEFSKLVQDEEHLNLLYCLSVADISATNDKEWNSWKDLMFRQLYFSTRQALRHGLEMPHDIKLHANENQQIALSYMKDLNEHEIRTYWSYFKPNYFIYYTPFELAWHTKNVLTFKADDKPLILFAQHKETGTEAFIYTKLRANGFGFGAMAYVMAQKRLSVQSAQIIRNKLNYCLCTVKFQSQKGQMIDNDRLHSIRLALIDSFNQNPSIDTLESDTDTKKIFKVSTVVNYLEDKQKESTNVEISALDQRGLLAKIALTFEHFGVYVRSARITTTGERADDFFSLTDKQGKPLTERLKDKLAKELYKVLEARLGQEQTQESKG